MDNLADFPALVSNDLLNGFTISDPDDFHQRYKQNSNTVFVYKISLGNESIEETIDTDDLDLDEAVKGFYTDFEEVKTLYGSDALLIAAECHFESNNCPCHFIGQEQTGTYHDG